MLHLAQSAKTRFYCPADAAMRAGRVSRQLYLRAYTLGWLGQVWSALTGRSPHLLNLAEVEARQAVVNRYSAGLRTVPLSQIRGSQGRCHDFDRNFYPLQDRLASRWLRVATAWKLGLALPPVKLIRLGEIYFVQDGHHRISVAQALGQFEINAEVRVWCVED